MLCSICKFVIKCEMCNLKVLLVWTTIGSVESKDNLGEDYAQMISRIRNTKQEVVPRRIHGRER